MKNFSIKRILQINLFLFGLTIVANFLGAQGYINEASQSDVSKSFPTMITPDGFTFGIWGVIYTLLFLSFVVAFIKRNESYYQKSIRTISALFWVSSFLNIAWIIVFSYKIIWLSAILIVLMFVTLFRIIQKLKIENGNQKGLFDLSFGLYAGWLAIASVVNFSAFLVSVGFEFWNIEKIFYTGLMIVFMVFIIFTQKIHKNPFFNLSIAWAFFGIIKKLNFESYTDYMFLLLIAGIVMMLTLSVMCIRKMKIYI